MERITFWNNKGGTGKTSLAFQTICQYAHENPSEKILVIDVCPQANLSELLLGGLHQGGSNIYYKDKGQLLVQPLAAIFSFVFLLHIRPRHLQLKTF